jgi:hypothetical protein
MGTSAQKGGTEMSTIRISCGLLLAMAMLASNALAQTCPFENRSCIIDLKSGVYSRECADLTPQLVARASTEASGGPFRIVTEPPLRNDLADDFFETVLKITFKGPSWDCTEAHITVIFEGEPSGWTVNIGDSMSNNGAGGDSAHQSRDSELWIRHETPHNPNYRTLTVVSSDHSAPLPPYNQRIWTQEMELTEGAIQFVVADMFFSWGPPYGFLNADNWQGLFALDGQDDFEGPVNYDIYAGFNRVIWPWPGPASRLGTGVEMVIVELK